MINALCNDLTRYCFKIYFVKIFDRGLFRARKVALVVTQKRIKEKKIIAKIGFY